MTEQETITVASVSDGRASVGRPGTDVALPVVELLTGRGFVTGKSGSGKSNTASVVVENLLDLGFPVLIVDIDGEYYGLKEKYEILHVGADDECDIQVSDEHAEKVADLTLNQNVPIILDVSSFLDEAAAADLLTEVTRHLFAKEKKLKKPFLIVVEEIHEYLPEGGGLDECGRMLIKVGKRGRKHGLGICGISQRPADVKKDFITQCDWLCWHRLTWRNDTRVVKRVLGNEYADAVEGLDDGEAFLATDWSDAVRRVQFDRKRTFDAGATPGLDDFQRPDLKSVSDDLVNELSAITEDEQRRADEIDRLRQELREKERRIEILEKDLENARDLRNLADQFASALFDHPGRSRMQLEREHEWEQEREHATHDDRRRAAGSHDAFPAVNAWSPASSAEQEPDPERERAPTARSDRAARRRRSGPASDGSVVPENAATAANGGAPDTVHARSQTASSASASSCTSASSGSASSGSATSQSPSRSAAVSRRSQAVSDSFEDLFADTTPWPSWRGDDAPARAGSRPSADSPTDSRAEPAGDSPDDADATFDILGKDSPSAGSSSGDSAAEQSSGVLVSGSNGERDGEQSRERPAQSPNDGLFNGLADGRGDSTEDASRGPPVGNSRGRSGDASHGASRGAAHDVSTQESSSGPAEREVVRQVRRVLESADAVTLGMLVRYRRQGPLAPEDAHVAAGGDGDRTKAYSRNSTLRQAGLVTHAGRGRYEYALRELVERTHDDRLSPGRVDAIVEQIEQELLLSPLDA